MLNINTIDCTVFAFDTASSLGENFIPNIFFLISMYREIKSLDCKFSVKIYNFKDHIKVPVQIFCFILVVIKIVSA